MLLSLQAGGVGLNLIGGNHVFLLDLHWNPALELQAADRCHRVGQPRDVYIHKFVCTGTVEERILQLQTKKLELAKNVLEGCDLLLLVLFHLFYPFMFCFVVVVLLLFFCCCVVVVVFCLLVFVV